MRRVLVIALFTLVVVPASFAALSAPGTLTVTANVTANCTVNNALLAFGGYDPTAVAALPGTAVLTVKCTKGLTPTLMLGQGSNPGGGSTNAAPVRQMIGAAPIEFMGYQLYQDVAHTIVWGNTVATGVGVAPSIAGTAVTVFGLVPAAQNLTALNTFSDTVQAVVNF